MKIGTIIAFGAGLVIGGVAAWAWTKSQYETLIDEEVESVKRAFDEAKDIMDKKIAEADKVMEEADKVNESTKKVQEEIEESFAARDRKYQQKVAYHKMSEPASESKVGDDLDIYEIDAQRIVEEDNDRPLVTLTLYRDGYLCDEDDQPVDDPEELIDMKPSEINFRDSNSLYIRNDLKNIDYEILKSEDIWADS